MIVRVFVPKPLDPTDGSDLRGTDHEFPMVPQVGQSLQFADASYPGYEVVRVGFIEEVDTFVASVWCRAVDMPLSRNSVDEERDHDNGDDYHRHDEPNPGPTGY